MEEKFIAPTSSTNLKSKDYFSPEDYAWIESLMKSENIEVEYPYNGYLEILRAIANAILDNNSGDIGNLFQENGDTFHMLFGINDFCRLMMLALKYGVACEEGACANYLGALYYNGEVVAQDYERAEKLYKLADSKGCAQACVNLGYIYEYGRTGEQDHLKAYFQYAKGAALYEHPEAYYKLGDMYSKGKIVKKDLYTAFLLYNKSYHAADMLTLEAQAAIRIAKLISNPENQKLGIPYDPLAALSLYQLAERGLRVDIAQGLTYYRKRLEEALEGQQRMREVLEQQYYD